MCCRLSRAHNQLVVVQPEVLRRTVPTRAHALSGAVNFQSFRFGKDLDVLHFLEKARVAHHSNGRAHQILLLLDHPGNVVGQTAPGIGNELSFFQEGHLGFRIQTHDLGCRFGTGSHTSDDDDF